MFFVRFFLIFLTLAPPAPCLSITFTKVQVSNYHLKLGLPCPFLKWSSALGKYAEGEEDRYSLLDYPSTAMARNSKNSKSSKYSNAGPEPLRTLSEIDVKLEAMDFIINPGVFTGYAPLLGKIVYDLKVSNKMLYGNGFFLSVMLKTFCFAGSVISGTTSRLNLLGGCLP